MRRYFGTDGVRGTFGREPMTPEFAFRLGRVAGRFFLDEAEGPGPEATMVVGRDTRASGPILEAALCQGLEREGLRCRRAGVIPTGAVAFLARHDAAAGGAMISASHNPAEDNGIKFFQQSGAKLSDEQEEGLENRLETCSAEGLEELEPTPSGFGADPGAFERYLEILHATVPGTFELEGVKVVVDAAHGAAWQTTPEMLRRLGAEVEVVSGDPDGENINRDCGSQHPAIAARRVAEEGAALGLCHDGDADRLVLVDEAGAILDGDELLAILAFGLKRMGHLPGDTLVATVMSNLGLNAFAEKEGIQLHRTGVGDRYVLEKMDECGAALGGEQSGHVIFREHGPTGDGLLTALQLLRILRESGQPLSELKRVLCKFPQRLESIPVREKPPIETIPGLEGVLSVARNQLGETGRIFLRYSGTENKIRLLVEARTESELSDVMTPVLACLRKTIAA